MESRLTLRATLTLGLVAVAAGVSLLLGVLLEEWGGSLLSAAGQLREAAARSAESRVSRTLKGVESSLRAVEGQIRAGAADGDDPLSVERVLFAQLLANPDLAEATLTRARGGEALSASGTVWQVSVFREGSPSRITTRRTLFSGGRFVLDARARPADAPSFGVPAFARLAEPGQDPRLHATFQATLEHAKLSAEPLWTDLHYAEADARLPEAQRRVVATAMIGVESAAGRPLGVLRAGLLAERLDEVGRIRVDEGDPSDPHRVFLADAQGRLLIRMRPDQGFEDQDGDLRPSLKALSDEMRAALAQPAVREVTAENPRRSGRFAVEGRAFLVSALYLEGAQGWRVGILVPEAHYLGDLQRTRRWLLAVSGIALLLLVAVGGATLRSVRRSLGGMIDSAAKMRRFDFSAARAMSPFRDVAEVMQDLEQAKTALRAMGKYVPIDLVRQLYEARREPQLGGERRDITVMFTDIEGFTGISERLDGDTLASALGRYLGAMTRAIHDQGGTVDKYIGDAVMAFWNAPEPRDDHPARACAAALGCLEATQRLFASPEWGALPRFHTRFGLHRDEVRVGHFGAPDRMSYTALGDGVNLASRLEGLNKAYGTTILVSQTVRDAAPAYAFRLIDVVAVKGREKGAAVYELVGTAARGLEERHRNYERAFAAYQGRRFAEALRALAPGDDDPPSRVLAERCAAFIENPPPDSWDGAHVAREK
jgi:adenylate cyclase